MSLDLWGLGWLVGLHFRLGMKGLRSRPSGLLGLCCCTKGLELELLLSKLQDPAPKVRATFEFGACIFQERMLF